MHMNTKTGSNERSCNSGQPGTIALQISMIMKFMRHRNLEAYGSCSNVEGTVPLGMIFIIPCLCVAYDVLVG